MFGRVERVEHLTPHMVRVVLGGDGSTTTHSHYETKNDVYIV